MVVGVGAWCRWGGGVGAGAVVRMGVETGLVAWCRWGEGGFVGAGVVISLVVGAWCKCRWVGWMSTEIGSDGDGRGRMYVQMLRCEGCKWSWWVWMMLCVCIC